MNNKKLKFLIVNSMVLFSGAFVFLSENTQAESSIQVGDNNSNSETTKQPHVVEQETDIKAPTVTEIPPGSRLINISVDKKSGVEDWGKPGSIVDVLFTFMQNGSKKISIIAKFAKIVSVDRYTQYSQDKVKASDSVAVTLLVKERQVRGIELARSSGELSIVLVSDSEEAGRDLDDWTSCLSDSDCILYDNSDSCNIDYIVYSKNHTTEFFSWLSEMQHIKEMYKRTCSSHYFKNNSDYIACKDKTNRSTKCDNALCRLIVSEADECKREMFVFDPATGKQVKYELRNNKWVKSPTEEKK